jgi:hypothetical protein
MKVLVVVLTFAALTLAVPAPWYDTPESSGSSSIGNSGDSSGGSSNGGGRDESYGSPSEAGELGLGAVMMTCAD